MSNVRIWDKSVKDLLIELGPQLTKWAVEENWMYLVGEFDGAGDSGGIEDVYLYRCQGGLHVQEDPTYYGNRDGVENESLRQHEDYNKLEVLLDKLLYQHFGGFENNDGGFGQIVLALVSREQGVESYKAGHYWINMNYRVTETHSEFADNDLNTLFED